MLIDMEQRPGTHCGARRRPGSRARACAELVLSSTPPAGASRHHGRRDDCEARGDDARVGGGAGTKRLKDSAGPIGVV
jgi:hypothetical protein